MTSRWTSQTFDRDAREGSRARHMVAGALEAWGVGGDRQAVVLMASELFTNAVCHGDGPVEMHVVAEADSVRVEVRDGGGGRPTLRDPDPTGERLGGWGLQLVDQLADAWGSEIGDGHTVVWAERRLASRVGS